MLRSNRSGWMILLCVHVAIGQNTFEVASVKAVEGGRRGLGALRGGPGTNSPGQLTGIATMKMLLVRAYDLKDYQILGPAWIDESRYQIQAKLPDDAESAQVGPMLQTLLAERFGLAAHRETRQLAGYDLTVAKTGLKLTPSKPAVDASKPDMNVPASPQFTKGSDGLPDLRAGTDVPRSYSIVLGGPDGFLYKVWGRRETMSQLADRLSAQLGRPVIDATKLPGEYDFTLAWAVESAGGFIPRAGPPPDQIETGTTPVLPISSVSVFTALETQLGLHLQPKKQTVAVLVIDRVNAKPTEN